MEKTKTLAQRFAESFLKTNQDKQLKEIVLWFENVQILTIPISCVEFLDFKIEEKDDIDEQKLHFSLNKHKKQFINKHFDKTNEKEISLSEFILQLNEERMLKIGIKEKDIEMIYNYPDLVSVELAYENEDSFKLYLPYHTEEDWFGENQFSKYQLNLKTNYSFSEETVVKNKLLTIYANKKIEVNDGSQLKEEFIDLKNDFEKDKLDDFIDLDYLNGCLMMIKYSHKK